MSNETNKPVIKFRSPRFSALWARLDQPDTKFKEQGVYSVKCVINPEEPEAAAFVAELDKAGEMALENAKKQINDSKLPPPKKKAALEALVLHPVYEAEYDKDGVETGNVIFTCKTYATRKKADGSEEQITVSMCDAHRTPVDASATPIGNGSTLRINGTFGFTYIAAQNKAYVSLWIGAVQLIELVAYNGSGFDDFGDEETNGEADFKAGGTENNGTFGGESNGDF